MRDEIAKMERNNGCNPVWLCPDTNKWFEEQNCAPEATPQDDKPDKAFLGRQWADMMTNPDKIVNAQYHTYTIFLEKYSTCFDEADDMTSRIRNVLVQCKSHLGTMTRADMLTFMARCLTIKNKQKFQEKVVLMLSSNATGYARKQMEALIKNHPPKSNQTAPKVNRCK